MIRLNRKQIEETAKKKYKELMKEPIYSPALKSNIYFTNKGWNHLVHNGTRSFNDIYRRLKLLPHIQPVVSKTKTYTSRSMGNIMSFQIKSKRKIIIYGKVRERVVRVVVILTIQNKYTFLSVM